MRKIRAITVVLLLIAIFPVHSDFYKFLRIIVTLVAGITSYSSFKKNNIEWTIVFLFIALIWNPIIPIYLNKTIWIILDLIAAAFFYSSVKMDFGHLDSPIDKFIALAKVTQSKDRQYFINIEMTGKLVLRKKILDNLDNDLLREEILSILYEKDFEDYFSITHSDWYPNFTEYFNANKKKTEVDIIIRDLFAIVLDHKDTDDLYLKSIRDRIIPFMFHPKE